MTDVLTAVLDVFDAVGSWIPTAVQNMIPMFWTEGTSGSGQLTFLGVLAVAGLAFSVIFLCFIWANTKRFVFGSALIAGKSHVDYQQPSCFYRRFNDYRKSIIEERSMRVIE